MRLTLNGIDNNIAEEKIREKLENFLDFCRQRYKMLKFAIFSVLYGVMTQ